MTNPNITPEGVEVKVGQLWRGNCPPPGPRVRRVSDVRNGTARLDAPGLPGDQVVRIRVKNMKNNALGWVLVEDVA